MITDRLITCSPSGGTSLERVRYFPRQLITADDLRQEQEYFRNKMRLHNRILHGWGVVCGAGVRKGSGDCEVIIEQGYILGPYGDDIVIDREVTIDLCREDVDGNALSPCIDPPDPWCSDVRVDRQGDQTVYIAVRYAECQARPIRVQHVGCGCAEADCEYSRIRDSFAVRVLTQLPRSYTNMGSPREPLRCPEDGFRCCPDCVADPWVILATINLRGKTAGDIDNTTHRRYVASFGNWWFTCAGPMPEPPRALLKVGAVRFIKTNPNGQERVLDRLGLPSDQPSFQNEWPTSIEVQFDIAEVDAETIVDGQNFIVTRSPTDQVISGQLEPKGQNIVRWQIPDNLPEGVYQVTLVGDTDNPRPIRLVDNSPLDGEPTAFPSGDWVEGGNFSFKFRLVTPP